MKGGGEEDREKAGRERGTCADFEEGGNKKSQGNTCGCVFEEESFI